MVTVWPSLGLVLSLLGSFPEVVDFSYDAVKYSIAILELVNQSTSAWVNHRSNGRKNSFSTFLDLVRYR